MRVILAARDAPLASAWRVAFENVAHVTIHEGSILDISCDALVSPANSFGFMDGGIDMLYSQRLGFHVQDRLRKRIFDEHNGELTRSLIPF